MPRTKKENRENQAKVRKKRKANGFVKKHDVYIPPELVEEANEAASKAMDEVLKKHGLFYRSADCTTCGAEFRVEARAIGQPRKRCFNCSPRKN